MKRVSHFRLSLQISLTLVLISLFSFTDFSSLSVNPFSQWTVLGNLPFTQEYHVTVAWQHQDTNFIITAGGRINGITSSNVLLYNTASGQYSPLPPMPMQIESAGGFVLGDSMYIVGGSTNTGNTFLNTLYKLDLTSNGPWVNKANFPSSMGEITYSTAERNDSLAYVAGGKNNAGPVNNVFLYNGKANNWFPANNLPIQSFGGGLSFVLDSLVIFTGGKNNDSALARTFLGIINPLNPANINWNTGPLYPGGKIYNFGNWGAKDGRVFFTGGENTFPKDNLATSDTYIYEDGPGFDTLSDKPTPITHAQVDGFIIDTTSSGYEYEVYALGGFDGSGASNKNEKLFVLDSITTSIHQISGGLPNGYQLEQNYPNPFNPFTTIIFSIPRSDLVELKVYDASGKFVSTLLSKDLTAGIYELRFDGSGLSSGIYFYTITAGEWREVRKMVLIK